VFSDAGPRLWSGKPLGYRASVVLPIDRSTDCVVLCDPDEQRIGRFRNLVRLRANGSIAWQADLPPTYGDDAYVAVRSPAAQLVANTWSGYRVDVDLDSGRILSTIFTK
jgi:hypothetical protein